MGINPIFRQVKETGGFVEICAVVFQPTITCPVEFDFTVSLSTCDGSAGVYNEVAILSISCKNIVIIILFFLHKLATLSS